jgi:aspartate-semialdehyde dehydrogenase
VERDVPLVVPEVNPRALFKGHSRIIANPNCSTIQMLVALKPLHDAYRARRIVVATYQAVSGAGHHGAMQLHHELHGAQVDRPAFPHAIAGNAIPHIAMFYSDGYTKEEVKMIDETHKILGDPTVRVAPTCVRIPVANCHSEAVNIEFERPFEIRTVRKLLEHAPGVVVVDDPADNRYPLAIHADGRDEVFVGRIRRDESVPNGLALWIVADNLRKGAATNAVQIAETWLEGPAAYHVATG